MNPFNKKNRDKAKADWKQLKSAGQPTRLSAIDLHARSLERTLKRVVANPDKYGLEPSDKLDAMLNYFMKFRDKVMTEIVAKGCKNTPDLRSDLLKGYNKDRGKGKV